MPSESTLRILRNRRAMLAVTISNKSEILAAATLDAKGSDAYVYQLNQAQAEYDALDDILNHFEHYTDDRSKIPIHPTIFIVALAFWAVVTVAAVLFLR